MVIQENGSEENSDVYRNYKRKINNEKNGRIQKCEKRRLRISDRKDNGYRL